MESADLDNRFKYHRPSPRRADEHQDVREACRYLAINLNRILPEGREKSLAMISLEETMFWSNAAIARSGEIQNWAEVGHNDAMTPMQPNERF